MSRAGDDLFAFGVVGSSFSGHPSWLNLVCTSGGLDGFERVGEVAG
jgi:hypothetical protein